MGDGDMKTEGVRVMEAPELGARVELVQGVVGDALRLIEAQREGLSGIAFMFEALAISLRIDGKRYTVEELKALPMHCTAALLRLGEPALELNRFYRASDGDDEADAADVEDDDPKT